MGLGFINLIKIVNEAGVTAPLQVSSEQALPLANAAKESLADRWLNGWSGVDTPKTVMTTRAPTVLKKIHDKLPNIFLNTIPHLFFLNVNCNLFKIILRITR